MRLKRRRKMAVRGHKLLKDKLDGLTHQFMIILKEYRKSSSQTYEKLSNNFSKMVIASALLIEDELDAITFKPQRKTSLKVKTRNIMGVKVPSYQLETENSLRNYGKLNVPTDIDQAQNDFSSLLPQLIKLSETKKAIELIAKEIYDVKRRVNALEFILIPELDKMVEYIGMKLEEMERSSRVTLIKVKEAINEI